MSTLNERAKLGSQQTYDSSTGTGSYIAITGTLSNPAAIVVFDNQSNVAVTISDDGTTDGKTFAAGQALSLDLRTNRSVRADDLCFRAGSQFYAKSAAGIGNFYISYVYAS